MDPQSEAPAPPEPEQYDAHTKVGNTLTVTQPGEQTICAIKRHPIGILGVYVAMGLLLVTTAILAFLVAPHFITDSTGSGAATTKFGALVFLLVAIISLVYTLIATKVYWGNSWVVTSDSITQVEQDSLFNRQSSQLSLGNLEDVTAEQNGVLPHLFNYGWLRVETAGERSKFVFRYCPNPNFYAQQVLGAREAFEQGRQGSDLQRAYRGQGSYQQPGPGPGLEQPLQPPSSQPPGQPPAQDQALQVGDPGYGAYQPQPYQPPTDSVDQGINT